MKYITSRRFTLPESTDDFGGGFWYNLWRIRRWPYSELIPGDILYWYESPSRCIVWESRVTDVDRFFYESREDLRERLEKRFGEVDPTQPYFRQGPERGYCLAWRAKPLQRVKWPKPADLRMPQPGWLRVNRDIASRWLHQTGAADDAILDDVVPDGDLIERIRELNTAMGEVRTERVRAVVEHTVRRDSQLVKALKEICAFRCQFPGCGTRIRKRDGGFYIEVAHIEPVSRGGPSSIGNLLVLCPNHHKEFDYGTLEIIEQTPERIQGTLNGKPFDIRLPAGVA